MDVREIEERVILPQDVNRLEFNICEVFVNEFRDDIPLAFFQYGPVFFQNGEESGKLFQGKTVQETDLIDAVAVKQEDDILGVITCSNFMDDMVLP